MFVNLLYPKVCGFCNKLLENGYICEKCKKEIGNFKNSYIPFLQNLYFDELYCVYEYKDIVRKRMLEYKFNHKKYLFRTFAESMIDNLKEKNINADFIVAVPIHFKRWLRRGYNQSALIAKEVSNQLQIPYIPKALIKPIATSMQSKLSKEERKQNVKHAFIAKENLNLQGKNILLIDDIYTTGATANECSKALKKVGANKVIISTVARATINSHID